MKGLETNGGKEDTASKLIASGTKLFALYGYSAVSIRQLAGDAQVNSALISYHFGSKEGLYRAVLEYQFAPIEEMVKLAQEKHLWAEDRVKFYGKAVMAVHQSRPYMFRLFFREMTSPTAAFEAVVKKNITKVFRLLYQVVEEGVNQDEFREEVDPGYAALSLAGIMNFYFISRPMHQNFLPQFEDGDARYIEQALEIYLKGVKKNAR